MTVDKQKFIADLIRHEVLKFGEFKLKSGDISPFYIDLRLVPSYPDLMKKSVSLLQDKLSQLTEEYIFAGLISAGVPFATGLSLAMNVPLVQIRSSSKDHGRKKLIEGKFERQDQVIIVDDLISTGASKIHAIDVIKEQELSILAILVLVDRRPLTEIGTPLKGIPIYSVCTIDDIISTIENASLGFTSDRKDEILKSIHDWVS